MFSTILGLLGGPLGTILKWLVVLLAMVGIVFGIYEWGHSAGYNSGYTSAWGTQQKTIDGMVAKDNAQAQANNNKIQELENEAQQLAQSLQQTQAQVNGQRTKVITQYVHDNPVTSNNCGLDTNAVKAINNLITADPAFGASAPVGASQ